MSPHDEFRLTLARRRYDSAEAVIAELHQRALALETDIDAACRRVASLPDGDGRLLHHLADTTEALTRAWLSGLPGLLAGAAECFRAAVDRRRELVGDDAGEQGAA